MEAYSAGSRPSGNIDTMIIEVMRESGIDISGQKSKGFDEVPINDFDYVVSMGCKDVCPFFQAKNHIEWKIEDPKGKDMEFFRNVRDKIRDKVFSLIGEISDSSSKGDENATTFRPGTN